MRGFKESAAYASLDSDLEAELVFPGVVRSLMICGVWVIYQGEQVAGSAYFLHFDLVPMLNRVVVASRDLATTERVVAPIHARWVRCRGAEKECVVLGVLRK